jgi:hypothetical protein
MNVETLYRCMKIEEVHSLYQESYHLMLFDASEYHKSPNAMQVKYASRADDSHSTQSVPIPKPAILPISDTRV